MSKNLVELLSVSSNLAAINHVFRAFKNGEQGMMERRKAALLADDQTRKLINDYDARNSDSIRMRNQETANLKLQVNGK